MIASISTWIWRWSWPSNCSTDSCSASLPWQTWLKYIESTLKVHWIMLKYLKSGIGPLLLQKQVLQGLSQNVSKLFGLPSHMSNTHTEIIQNLIELRMKWAQTNYWISKSMTYLLDPTGSYWQVPSSCDWHPWQLASLELWTSIDLNVQWSNARNDIDPLQPSVLPRPMQTYLHNEMHQNMRSTS